MISGTTKTLAAVAVAVVVGVAASAATAGTGSPDVAPQSVTDSQLQGAARTTVTGGADVVPTTRTIPHWWGSTLDPLNGTTYGYNVVGANPSACAGAACDVTVQVDITPIVLAVDGMTFSGGDVLPAALASPQFTLHDYGSTPYATGPDLARAAGGVLSQDDAGNPLQLEDAVMRAEFGKTGSSSYHLRLHPNVLPPVTIDVPQGQGLLLRNTPGVVFAAVDYQWWVTQVQNLETKADPTHLALYLTDDTFTYLGSTKSFQLEAVGFHGARATGDILSGTSNSNGNAPVQTFAWVTWLSPGLFARPNGGFEWALQDMNVLSHELGEWANDPFTNNLIQAWPYVPGHAEYGCSPLIETGDAVGASGFAMGTNTFRQGPNPNGTQSADGYYHPQDELFLPWFLRVAPNALSEPTQTPSPDIGRYSFMGDLERQPGFSQPAPACP